MERITIEMVNKAPIIPAVGSCGNDPFAHFFNFDSRCDPWVWKEYFSPPSELYGDYEKMRDGYLVMSPSPNMRIGYHVDEIYFKDPAKSVSRSYIFFRAIKIDDVIMHEAIDVCRQEAFEPSKPITNFNFIWRWMITFAVGDNFIQRDVVRPVFDTNQTILDFWNGDAHLSPTDFGPIGLHAGVNGKRRFFLPTESPDEIVEQILETFDHYVFGDAMTAAYALVKIDTLGD